MSVFVKPLTDWFMFGMVIETGPKFYMVLFPTQKVTDSEFLYKSFVINVLQFQFLAHLSRRLTRWAYRMGLEPGSVRASMHASTLSNMNISETSRPITTKFYLKHHWDGGKVASGFDADQIRTLVSMAWPRTTELAALEHRKKFP